jgi:excisionase family DNA binding protein
MTNDGDLLQLIEVARLARVSVSSVRHWIKSGRLASIRPGKRRLVRRAEFERFLDRQDGHNAPSTAA